MARSIVTMEKIKTLRVTLSNEIKLGDVSLFRSAILSILGDVSTPLFHNHDGEYLRYEYPLIQYKSIRKKASIVCVGDGADSIGQLFSNIPPTIRIGSRVEPLEVVSVKANTHLVQLWDNYFTYSMYDWMPLVDDRYVQYLKMDSIAEKAVLLERVLWGNIVSFTQGVNLDIDKEKLSVKIVSFSKPKIDNYKDTKMMKFNIVFKTNISLPNYIGLGKGASLGHGVLIQKKGEED